MALVGISTTYFASRGFNIYDSVKRASELGFETIELGAGHKFEPGIWETLERIKKDFPETSFTLHGLFPPQKEKLWFNAALGLTDLNKRVLGEMFRAVSIVKPVAVSLHPGYAVKMEWGETKYGMNEPKSGKPIGEAQAAKGIRQVLGYALQLAKEAGTPLLIENNPTDTTRSILKTRQAFQNLFDEFPGLGFLFDIGHARIQKKFEEFLELNKSIGQLHLHFNQRKIDQHLSLPEDFDLGFLKKIPQIKEIPLIFEHGNNVKEEEILREKKKLEDFLQSL